MALHPFRQPGGRARAFVATLLFASVAAGGLAAGSAALASPSAPLPSGPASNVPVMRSPEVHPAVRADVRRGWQACRRAAPSGSPTPRNRTTPIRASRSRPPITALSNWCLIACCARWPCRRPSRTSTANTTSTAPCRPTPTATWAATTTSRSSTRRLPGLQQDRRLAVRPGQQQHPVHRLRRHLRDHQQRRPGGPLRSAGRPLGAQLVHLPASNPTHQCIAVSTSPDPLGSLVSLRLRHQPARPPSRTIRTWPSGPTPIT